MSVPASDLGRAVCLSVPVPIVLWLRDSDDMRHGPGGQFDLGDFWEWKGVA